MLRLIWIVVPVMVGCGLEGAVSTLDKTDTGAPSDADTDTDSDSDADADADADADTDSDADADSGGSTPPEADCTGIHEGDYDTFGFPTGDVTADLEPDGTLFVTFLTTVGGLDAEAFVASDGQMSGSHNGVTIDGDYDWKACEGSGTWTDTTAGTTGGYVIEHQ